MTKALQSDLLRGLLAWPLWGTIGWIEVEQRYRRSVIGPFWITLSLGVVVLGLGVVYAVLFNQNVQDYMPYLAVGLIIWTLIAAMINEGCQTFIAAEYNIKMLSIPLSVYALRMVWRNLIILAHNMVIYVVVMLWFQSNPGWMALLSLPGFLLLAVNGVAFGLSLGVLSARFRDIPLMASNAVQLAFFITPILWKPASLTSKQWIMEWNPFYHLIEVVRRPLLGQAIPTEIWTGALLFTLINLVIGVMLFRRYRWRLAYWV